MVLKQKKVGRILWPVLLLAVAYVGLGYRLLDLQVLRHDQWAARAQQNTQREYLLEPRRGDILDVRGAPLATSLFVKTVCADPALIGAYPAEVAHALAPLLQESEKDLCDRLTPRVKNDEMGNAATNRYVVIKRKVPLETWTKIQEALKNLPVGTEEKTLTRQERGFFRDLKQKAIFTDPMDDQLRVYPNGCLAAQVLGYVGMVERELNGKPVLETAGMDGVEKTFDSKLAGVRGWRLTETDRLRREQVNMREQDVQPRDGFNVVLTIDSVIQSIVEEAIKEGAEKHSPASITGVVVRPRTGEILAMATLPTFNPNNPGNDAASRRNRVITDVVEPGSTFKIVVVSGALNDGIVRLNEVFDCEHGHFHFGGKVLHDHEGYGALSVEQIITKSSNIGAAKVGIKLGQERLYDYIRNYGFGTRSGIPLQGEVFGIVHSVDNWSKCSIAQIPMGQGVSVTRLQMIMAMSAIANNGCLMRPMLIDRLEDSDHKVVAKYAPQRVRQVISESAAKMMVQALKTVVSSNGTAPKAALEHYTVGGKTGTAQKVENGVYVRKYISSFIGFFPADNPELCISVVFDDPKQGYYGGQAAAPVFHKIAEQAANYLNIRPEGAPDVPLPESVSKTNNGMGKSQALIRQAPRNVED